MENLTGDKSDYYLENERNIIQKKYFKWASAHFGVADFFGF